MLKKAALLAFILGISFVLIYFSKKSSNSSAAGTQDVKVWMLSYLPPKGVKSLYPLAQVSDPVGFTQNTLLPAMNNASKYKGYASATAIPALHYYIASPNDIKVEYNPPPVLYPTPAGGFAYRDALIMKYDLCKYAKANDIKVVMVWAAGSGKYASNMWESAITGSNGIQTNGNWQAICPDKTIVIYGFNYERGLAEAMESYGHHLEAVFWQFRPEYKDWSDDGKTPNKGLVGAGDSCGTDHNPPNARFEYDRANYNYIMSDCRNWKPDGTGVKERMTCYWWGCDGAKWLTWWMQNMPGLGNTLFNKDGSKTPNWWVYIGDPDGCFKNPLTCSGGGGTGADQTPPAVLFTYPTDGGTIKHYVYDTMTANATDNVKVTKVEFYVNGKLACTDTVSSYTCGWYVPYGVGKTYTLMAKAYDAAGNTGTKTITVTSIK